MTDQTTQQQFEQLIGGMSCSDNQTRNFAEKSYEQIPLQQKGTHLFDLYMNESSVKDVKLYKILNYLYYF